MPKPDFYSELTRQVLLRRRRGACKHTLRDYNALQLVFGVFAGGVYLLCFAVFREHVDASSLASLAFQVGLALVAAGCVLLFEVRTTRVRLQTGELELELRTLYKWLRPRKVVFGVEALEHLRVVKALELRDGRHRAEYRLVLDKPERLARPATPRRSYSGQGFCEHFERDECLGHFLEQDRVGLFASRDLFSVKRRALELLVFGLGARGKAVFDAPGFAIESNRVFPTGEHRKRAN